jgi:hypothetical protein
MRWFRSSELLTPTLRILPLGGTLPGAPPPRASLLEVSPLVALPLGASAPRWEVSPLLILVFSMSDFVFYRQIVIFDRRRQTFRTVLWCLIYARSIGTCK